MISNKKRLLQLIWASEEPSSNLSEISEAVNNQNHKEEPKVCIEKEQDKKHEEINGAHMVYGEIEFVHPEDGGTILLDSGQTVDYLKDQIQNLKYNLEEGDAVHVKCILDDHDEIQVLALTVEEEYNFNGVITKMDQERVVVNEDISFKGGVFPLGHFNVGDLVTGTYWKTSNRKYPYRAVSISKVGRENNDIHTDFNERHIQMQMAFEQKKAIVLSQTSITLECTRDSPHQVFDLKVNNISTRNPYKLITTMVEAVGEKEPIVKVTGHQNNIVISPRGYIYIRIEATPQEFPTVCNERLILFFDKMEQAVSVQIIAGDEAFLAKLRGQYRRSDSIDLEYLYKTHLKNEVTELRLENNSRKKSKFKIQNFPKSKRIPMFLKLDEYKWLSYIEDHFEYILDPIDELNYIMRWHTSLDIAELYANKVVRETYDQRNVKLKNSTQKNAYYLNVKNVAEQRPSILPGDKVSCHILNGMSMKGVILTVLQNQVLIEMSREFANHCHNLLDVNFIISNFAYRIQHEVVHNILNRWKNAIFPKSSELIKNIPTLDVALDKNQLLVRYGLKPLVMNNKCLNHSQLTTIRNVLRGEYRPSPYLISGPPGTGKTTVLVEIIGQLVSNLPKSKLLVCTQSNSAADLILKKLLESKSVNSDIVLRLIGKNRSDTEGSVPEELRKHCGIIKINDRSSTASRREDDILEICDLMELYPKKILIMTCGSVGYLTKMELPENYFSHLILDEAGQCLETEAIVPISLMSPLTSQIIMAGDEKQLGPVVHSQALKRCKYDLSLFERLLQTPLYNRSQANYNHTLSNLLIYNYRSVPSVLKLYNDLFYNASLKSMIEAKENPCLKGLSSLFPLNENRPPHHSVFFYDVMGEDRQCEDNPSWMNLREAEVVKYLYEKLLTSGVNTKDIGIISPYQGQVKHLKSILLPSAVIGSVAEFQGQEKQVIILSTVRSNLYLLDHDRKFGIGFISDEKQINVAVSRAQYLLLIVGNASLLNINQKWKEVIKYSTENYAFIDEDQKFLDLFPETLACSK